MDKLRHLVLLVRPDTILRWHRDLLRRRHAAVSALRRRERQRTVRTIRLLVLRLVRKNTSWGYRRIHGELVALGVKVAASTVWEILKTHGIDPSPERTATTWAAFLRSQADALLSCDYFEVRTLAGARPYTLAVIEHATRRIRVLGVTAHPTGQWVTQLGRNLAMDRHLLHALREFETFYNEHCPPHSSAGRSASITSRSRHRASSNRTARHPPT